MPYSGDGNRGHDGGGDHGCAHHGCGDHGCGDDAPIQVQVTAIHAICGRLTSAHLADLRRSVEQASLIPRQLGWERKATAHAEIFGLLADAADHPALARMLSLGAGLAHHLMVTAGPAAGLITVSSRRRLLAHLAAADAAAAADEMERHLRVLRFMGRLAGSADHDTADHDTAGRGVAGRGAAGRGAASR